MNILLVYPEMPDTFWSMKHMMRVIGKKSSYPPLGLLTISQLLPPHWNKKLIDLNVSRLRQEDILWADYVFLSAMNVQEESAKEVIGLCNEAQRKIVAGGPLFTHEHSRFPTVDYFVLNEAEITLPLFIADHLDGNLQRIYTSAQFADVKNTPLPDWGLIDLDQYAYAIVQYSRGCPYLCDFCDVTSLFGRNPRTKTPDQIIQELENILRLGQPEVILFADDNLIGNRRDLKNNLLPALIEWRKAHPFAPGFITQVTINLADDDELMQMLIDAGFRDIFIGIESPSTESLEACHKTQNLRRDLFANITKLQKAGFIVTGGFIVGFDSDDQSIFDTQIDFIQNSGIVLATVNILKAPPGTELYERMHSENRLIETFNFDENRTNIKTKLGYRELYEGYKKVLDIVYHPKHIVERANIFLLLWGNFKSASRIQRNVSLRDLITLVRIIIMVGCHYRVAIYFWSVILTTLRHKRANIVLAVRVGVLLYQFHHLHRKFLRTYRSLSHNFTD